MSPDDMGFTTPGPEDPAWGLTITEIENPRDWLRVGTLEHAIAFAAHAHEGQKDKAGQPYILHPLRVMLSGTVYDVLDRVVAVLHDVAEDTVYKLPEIDRTFGHAVTATVDILTRRERESYDDYIQRILDSKDDIAVRVKMADLKDNMDMSRIRDPNAGDMARFYKYVKAARRLEREGQWAFE